MVIKISKTSTVEGVVEYNTRKVEEGKAHILSSSLIPSAAGTNLTRDDIVAGFQERIALNHRTRNTMTHISLNPDPKESLSDVLLTKIAEDFITQLGYGEQPYIVVKHEDIDRAHVHIVLCNIDANGQKIDDAFEKKRSNDIRKGLENKYNLLKAEEQGAKRHYTLQKADAAKGNHFVQLRDIGGGLASEYAYGSVNEYRALCEAYNIFSRTVGDVKSGTAELMYGIGQDDFAAPPILGKQLAEFGMTYKDIALRAERNAEKVKRHCASQKLKQVMQGLMNLDNLDELRKQSGRLGLAIQFRQTEDGRVYGATVIDYKKKIVFKASALGREFSARNWQKFFEPSAVAEDGMAAGMAAKKESGGGNLLEVAMDREVDSLMPMEREEPSLDGIADLITQGSLIDTSAWGGGGSRYKPDKKKRKKKRNL